MTICNILMKAMQTACVSNTKDQANFKVQSTALKHQPLRCEHRIQNNISAY